ncbi:MAG: nucleotide pyrophosphohydrolase [Bacteroidota bacterium]
MDKFQTELTDQILAFQKSRNWGQFHTGKDLAICLSVEANELLELFLWKSEEEVDKVKLSDEIGDVIYSLVLLSHKFNIDIKEAFETKMLKNENKYPINKFFGSNKKYNDRH